MSKTFIYRKKSVFIKPKSKRPHQYLYEQAQKLRQRVLIYSLLVALFFLGYLLFYSNVFKIENIILEGSKDFSQTEANELVAKILDSYRWLILPQNNYFLFGKSHFNKEFQEKYPFSELSIKKSFPSTLNIEIRQGINQSVWIANEQLFLIDHEGVVVRRLPFSDLSSVKIPLIYDLSNTKIEIGETALELETLKLVQDLQQNFNSYNLPKIELDYFKIDSPRANYVKLVAKQGFEIHLNTILPLIKQIYKLQKSLEAGKIDLNKISYINLRIDDQVIYK